MKFKDGLGQEDLEQYSLKNFDLKAYQLAQAQPDPAPLPAALPAPCDPYLPKPEADTVSPVAAAPEAPSPTQLEPNPWSSTPYEVQFGAHFNLQTVSYTPLSPAQSWKIPRWVVGMVGLFFGSAAVVMIVFCVVLLRDPTPAPAAQLAAPTAPVAATTSAAPARPNGDVTGAASAPALADRAAVRHPAPATTNPRHDDAAPARRIVVSRHPTVVRRQSYGSRRVASKSESSSVAAQETETASRRPPPDALDKLLSESTL